MSIEEIYQKYEIPPNLIEHMLRVAGVGKIIVDNWIGTKIDKQKTVLSCLLHDMGNIAKFDLSDESARKFGITDLEHWREVQKKFWQKYGTNASEATWKICDELELPDIKDILQEQHDFFFTTGKNDAGWEAKVVGYADYRVMPNSVVSIEKRMKDLEVRYGHKLQLSQEIKGIASEIESKTSIDIEMIDEAMVRAYFSQLLSVTI